VGEYLVDAASGHHVAAEKQRDGLGIVLCLMVGHALSPRPGHGPAAEAKQS
jgi:hypothetical protein